VSAVSEGAGLGSVFEVRLPIAGPVRAAAPAARPVSSKASARRILVVEDNADARQMLRAMLEVEGHFVRDAADGAQALRMVAEQRPDVMIVDIGLPDMDGYEIARIVRAGSGGEGIVMVALTGYGQAEDKRRAMENGFNAHATKPVLPDHLAEIIESAARAVIQGRG
jgi:CheY-like chemotaxis protein